MTETTTEKAERIKERDSVSNLEEIADIVGLPVEALSNLDMNDLGDKISQELTRHVAKALVQDQIKQTETPDNNPFVSYTVDDLRDLPEPGWHIDGVLPVGIDSMVFGQAYAGKTLVVLDMLLSIANGVPWMGHATKARDVALVIGEGQRGIAKRVDAWLAAHPGCNDDGLAIVTVMPDIRNRYEVTYLMQAFVDVMHEHWPEVIAWDTWSRLTVGANENDPTAMTECVTVLAHIREVFGLNATNIVLHHTGWQDTERPRGASTFVGAFDTLIRVDPTEIVNTKQKDNEEFEDIHFSIEKSANSVVVYHSSSIADFATNELKKSAELERMILQVVNEEPGLTITELRKRIHKRRADITITVDILVLQKRIVERDGEKNAKLLFPV